MADFSSPAKQGESLLASVKAPYELYDLDMGAEHWIRKDACETAAKAKALAQGDIDASWTQLRCETVWCKIDAEHVADTLADGGTEPYDGWRWTAASKDEPGAVAYWHIYIKGRA